MNFRTFDLNLLRVLDALLREGSTVAVGRKLGLSQPAVSAALSRLRHALGDALFVRQGAGLVPTDFARDLALPLRQELDRIEAMLSAGGSFDPATAEGTFRIAGSDFFGEFLMPRLARKLGTQAPGLRVQLVELVPSDYVDSLEQYRADLALIPDATFPDWVDRAPMFYSSFVTIARVGHPALVEAGVKPGEPLPLDLFCRLGHILFSPEGRVQSLSDAALARIGRRREVRMTLPVFSGVCRTVAESELISMVPRQIAELRTAELGLTIHPAPMPVVVPLIVAIWHGRSTTSPLHRFLRGLVADVLRPLNEGEAPLPL